MQLFQVPVLSTEGQGSHKTKLQSPHPNGRNEMKPMMTFASDKKKDASLLQVAMELELGKHGLLRSRTS